MDDPGVDIISIIKGYDIPTEFGEKVMNQIERDSGGSTDWRSSGQNGSSI